MNSCRVTHLPTGIVEKREGRNRIDNERDARQSISNRLDAMSRGETATVNSEMRRDQAGSGMRGDKIRTIRFQDDSAVDHSSGKRMKATDYLKGKIDQLW
jgi:peptide chain release factor 1